MKGNVNPPPPSKFIERLNKIENGGCGLMAVVNYCY